MLQNCSFLFTGCYAASIREHASLFLVEKKKKKDKAQPNTCTNIKAQKFVFGLKIYIYTFFFFVSFLWLGYDHSFLP